MDNDQEGLTSLPSQKEDELQSEEEPIAVTSARAHANLRRQRSHRPTVTLSENERAFLNDRPSETQRTSLKQSEPCRHSQKLIADCASHHLIANRTSFNQERTTSTGSKSEPEQKKKCTGEKIND